MPEHVRGLLVTLATDDFCMCFSQKKSKSLSRNLEASFGRADNTGNTEWDTFGLQILGPKRSAQALLFLFLYDHIAQQ